MWGKQLQCCGANSFSAVGQTVSVMWGKQLQCSSTADSAVSCLVWSSPVVSAPAAGQETAATWMAMGEKAVEEAKARLRPLDQQAKNVILFLGDGMGVSTVTAARILNGGEGSLLTFEKFPYTAMSKTYCADHQVTDSAASSTAFQCGVKTNKGTLGVDQRVPRYDCPQSLEPGMALTSILDWSLAAGKSVGLVTTTRITHATPAGAYANVADRDWEGDSELTESARQGKCRDIAQQLIEDYPNVQVLMGGGRRYFLPKSSDNDTYGRQDGRDLTQEWLSGQKGEARRAVYVENAQQLRQLDVNSIDYLLGLFSMSHMSYESQRDPTEQPSLAEMTKAAITILSRNPKGFYLLVEGGRIDHSHHENNAYNALHDTVSFAEAVEMGGKLTSVRDTLTVTTADHSHTMVIAGYPTRGNPILDVVDNRQDEAGKNFTTLLYGDGPGYRQQLQRVSVTNAESSDPDYKQESAVPMTSASHGGEDVTIFAQGPMAHLFHGVQEETFIAHVMAYASCVGHYGHSGKCPPAASSAARLSGALSAVVWAAIGWLRL
ncbi:hypothetical protein ACOMHN_049929 [Nucella lapillus]